MFFESEPNKAGIEGDKMVLNGGKIFNSHGDYASHWVIWCRFGPSTDDIGLVLLERGNPGLHISPARLFVSGDYYVDLGFDECRIPADQVLLPSHGFKKMINSNPSAAGTAPCPNSAPVPSGMRNAR